jgi:hypothetical protein
LIDKLSKKKSLIYEGISDKDLLSLVEDLQAKLEIYENKDYKSYSESERSKAQSRTAHAQDPPRPGAKFNKEPRETIDIVAEPDNLFAEYQSQLKEIQILKMEVSKVTQTNNYIFEGISDKDLIDVIKDLHARLADYEQQQQE